MTNMLRKFRKLFLVLYLCKKEYFSMENIVRTIKMCIRDSPVTAAETRAHMGLTKVEEIRALFDIKRTTVR